MSSEELSVLKKQINEWLELGHIVLSASPCGHSVLFAEKKGGGGLRLCADYHFLNANILKDAWLLLCIDEFLSQLKGARFFNSLDLWEGYHWIPIHPANMSIQLCHLV